MKTISVFTVFSFEKNYIKPPEKMPPKGTSSKILHRLLYDSTERVTVVRV